MFYFVLLAWFVSCILKLISSNVCSIVAAVAPVPSKKLESFNLALQPSNCLLWCHWLVWNVSRVPVLRNVPSQNVQQARILQSLCANMKIATVCQVPWECSVKGVTAHNQSEQNSSGATCVCGNSSCYSCPLRIRVQALRWYKWKAIDYVPWFIMHALRCRSILTDPLVQVQWYVSLKDRLTAVINESSDSGVQGFQVFFFSLDHKIKTSNDGWRSWITGKQVLSTVLSTAGGCCSLLHWVELLLHSADIRSY